MAYVLAYLAFVITLGVLIGWRCERHLSRVREALSTIGESLAEVEARAVIHTSRPGAAEETSRLRALRSSQSEIAVKRVSQTNEG